MGELFFCLQMKKATERNVRRAGLLRHSARTGNVEIWQMAVKAVEAEERCMLKEVKLDCRVVLSLQSW